MRKNPGLRRNVGKKSEAKIPNWTWSQSKYTEEKKQSEFELIFKSVTADNNKSCKMSIDNWCKMEGLLCWGLVLTMCIIMRDSVAEELLHLRKEKWCWTYKCVTPIPVLNQTQEFGQKNKTLDS